jgi:pyruvate/2-oxoglutarate/acetoin dehydrogenase E1 component
MKELSYVRAINEALREEMARDENVFMMGLDIGLSGGSFSATRGLYEEFGDKRVRDYPICESSLMGLAIGAAVTGLRPVVEIMFMDFLAVCMDPIVNAAAKMHFEFGGQYKAVPLTIRTPVGQNAGPDHTQSLEAWFTHIPGLKVVMPSNTYDVKGLLKSSIRDDNPVLFIEHLGLLRAKGEVPEEEYVIPLGKAEVKREGTDITVVAWGRTVNDALSAAEELADEGFSVEVVDVRTLSPLDKEAILNSVRKTGRVVVAHEAVKTGGFGGEIAAIIAEEAFDYLDAPVKRVGALFAPLSFCPALEDYCLPDKGQLIAAIKETVK